MASSSLLLSMLKGSGGVSRDRRNWGARSFSDFAATGTATSTTAATATTTATATTASRQARTIV